LAASLLVSSWCHAGPGGCVEVVTANPDVIHLSNLTASGSRCDAAAAPIVLPVMPATTDVDEGLATLVRHAASDHGVDPALVHALISVESGYRPRAVSPRGAMGLMQLMPATAHDYGVTDPFDARQNIQAGVRHLRNLLDQFGQDMRLALAAYNAGAAAVRRHGHRIPPYAETLAYVPRVMQLAARNAAR
jgi:soluble lytic murein transglycosylase-like protein